METRRAVVATQYRLRTKKDGKWDINCPAKVDEGTKVHPTEYIQEMNSIDNNLHFVIDEEATETYLERLEQRIANAKVKNQQNSMSTAEVLGQILKTQQPKEVVSKPKKEKVVEEVKTVEELRAECDELGISYHTKAGVKKLTELLEQNK